MSTQSSDANENPITDDEEADMSKAKVTKTNLLDQTKTYSHKIFLANLGVFGKVYEESKLLADKSLNKYKDITSKNSEMLEDLIARGEKVQSSMIETVKKAKNEQMTTIEVRVKSLRANLSKAKDAIVPAKKVETEKAVEAA